MCVPLPCLVQIERDLETKRLAKQMEVGRGLWCKLP
jgi:hypothetical protein